MADDVETQKTNFGNLLQQYREDKHLSQIDLQRLLWKNEYLITNGLVSRYESGKRNPPPEFIYRVSKVLNLKKEQTDALIAARFADDQSKFLKEYYSISG